MQIQNPISTTENCRYCLMCRHVCPVGHITRQETLTPHGWGLTIASVRRGLLQWNEETVDVLYSCADCGSCRANCVTDQPLPDAIAAARAEVVSHNLAPAVVYELNEALQRWGNPYATQTPQPVTDRQSVALFVGDDAHYLQPDSVVAVLKLLRAIGIEPALIGVGRSNGYLSSSLGFPETARALAEANLADLEATGASRLLVLTPGDYFTFSQLYNERLGVAWPADIELFEVTSLLAEQLGTEALQWRRLVDETPYAYVDPTHSVRVAMRYDAPRRLLSAVMPTRGLELFWRRQRAHANGNTALQWTQPHLANHLTYSRLDDARKSGAQLLITEDPGSLTQLGRHAARFGLRVQGLYELLADCLV